MVSNSVLSSLCMALPYVFGNLGSKTNMAHTGDCQALELGQWWLVA